MTARPARPSRVRLDELVVARGLATSRSEAARIILAGRVQVGGARADKAGRLVPADADVALAATSPYVGRGGEKLAGALDAFGLPVAGRVCLDVGSSTGGFTDCLLARGARRVYAVDVGHGQLHPRLRGDPRVVVLERVNARHLDPGAFPERPSLATVDVSFISLAKVLPSVAGCLADPADVVALVKPQFEVGRGRVGKGGVVRDATLHREAVRRVAGSAVAVGLEVGGVAASPLRGPKGNREFFLLLARDPGKRPALRGAALEAAIERAVATPARAAPGPAGAGTAERLGDSA
jgi:23S rRNA (cytidine1920-2'-O)/16S rRNA (cytidine1409-2'-O)-methyltransferase